MNVTDSLYTFQEFEKAENRGDFILAAIKRHKSSDIYKTAEIADSYDRQMNETINNYVKTLFDVTGNKVVNFTATNAKIASNFFHRLNTQRCMYSLGNGVSFIEGAESGKDVTKEALGVHFDHDIIVNGFNSLKHGITFGFWNVDRLYNFPITELVPLWDEYDGTLKAAIRFWQLDPNYPMSVILYEIDGFTKYQTKRDSRSQLEEMQPKRAYKQTVAVNPTTGKEEIIGVENYSSLPIVPLWGSRLHQSTIIGMREAIDSYDLINSGFANNLQDCSEIYWIIENAGGMTEKDMARFLDRLVVNHIAQVDAGNNTKVTPYRQELPFEARKAYLEGIRNQIYEDFGALDVHTVAAGATNDHIDAAYQPMDEEASDFEYQVAEFIRQILALMGIDDSPVFKRNRISNQMEQVEMVVAEAQWLDTQTILQKLPNVSPDEVDAIMKRNEDENAQRMNFASNFISVTENGTVREETQEEE